MSSGMRIVATLAVVVASVLALTWATSAQAPKPAERQQWEYKLVSEFSEPEAEFTRYGSEGWELITVVPYDEGVNRRAYFKRPKAN